MNTADEMTDREMVHTRVFDAPADVVFAAWSDPEHISHWWGPRGFRTTTSLMEFRPGGRWSHVMHGPDGTDYVNEVVYRQIDRPRRIAYDHVNDPKFHAVATFVDLGGRTELTFRLTFETPFSRDQTELQYGAMEGLRHTLARLGETLGVTSSHS